MAWLKSWSARWKQILMPNCSMACRYKKKWSESVKYSSLADVVFSTINWVMECRGLKGSLTNTLRTGHECSPECRKKTSKCNTYCTIYADILFILLPRGILEEMDVWHFSRWNTTQNWFIGKTLYAFNFYGTAVGRGLSRQVANQMSWAPREAPTICFGINSRSQRV